jgi:hypothetical protein
MQQKINELMEWCNNHPTRVRENLLLFKTWLRLGNMQRVPYLEATLEECLEWIHK